MNLSLLVLTINGRDKLSKILPALQNIADELVIGIDDTTVDDSFSVARQFTDKVYYVGHEGFCGGGQKGHPNAVEDMLGHCCGQWVLRIDHDETLSPLWSDKHFLESLLADRYATHYWIPRRWVLPPGDQYISNRWWHPDYQLRLFRNIPSLIRFNRAAHEPPVIAGEGRRINRAWINHLDLLWHDRNYREAKVKFYKAFSTYTGEEYYCYEDYHFDTKPLSYVAPSHSRMGLVPGQGGQFSASIRVLEAPSQMYVGEAGAFLIEIHNDSNRCLVPPSNLVAPSSANVSYHWYRDGTPPMLYEWEGARGALPCRIAPGESGEDYLSVSAPREPGQYLLQLDLVEEHVAWYSTHGTFPSIPVSVIDPAGSTNQKR